MSNGRCRFRFVIVAMILGISFVIGACQNRAYTTLLYNYGDSSYGWLDILQKEGQWYVVQTNNQGEELYSYSYTPQLPSTSDEKLEMFTDGVFVSDGYGIVTYNTTTPPMGLPVISGHCGDVLIQLNKDTQTAQCVYNSGPKCRILYGNDEVVIEYDASKRIISWIKWDSKTVLHSIETTLEINNESYAIYYEPTSQNIMIYDKESRLVQNFSISLGMTSG